MSEPAARSGLRPAKDSIDLGIVTDRLDEMTQFYRDIVGLEDLGVTATRSTAGGQVRTLRCGTSLVKLVSYADGPAVAAPAGGVRGATGYRYWTITVPDLDGIVASCERAGRLVVVPVKQVSEDVAVAIVEDPDGNWVEFLREM